MERSGHHGVSSPREQDIHISDIEEGNAQLESAGDYSDASASSSKDMSHKHKSSFDNSSSRAPIRNLSTHSLPKNDSQPPPTTAADPKYVYLNCDTFFFIQSF